MLNYAAHDVILADLPGAAYAGFINQIPGQCYNKVLVHAVACPE